MSSEIINPVSPLEYFLGDLIKCLIEWIIVKPALMVFRFFRFCTTTAARCRRMRDYNRFVQNEYTNRGERTPALIVRIQNGYIRKYNEAANYWAGKILLMKPYPEVETKPHPAGPTIKCSDEKARTHKEEKMAADPPSDPRRIRHRPNGRAACNNSGRRFVS